LIDIMKVAGKGSRWPQDSAITRCRWSFTASVVILRAVHAKRRCTYASGPP